jgi:hypothetical protein
MPDISVRVMAQVPTDAGDIRDGADVGLERVDGLQFRARLFDIGALAFLAGGALLGALALVGVVSGKSSKRSRDRIPVSDRRVLAAASAELGRVARDADAGWTPELVAPASRRSRRGRARARPRRQRAAAAAGAQPADGRMAVPADPRRPGPRSRARRRRRTLAGAGREGRTEPRANARGLSALRDALARSRRPIPSATRRSTRVAVNGARRGRAEAERLAGTALAPLGSPGAATSRHERRPTRDRAGIVADWGRSTRGLTFWARDIARLAAVGSSRRSCCSWRHASVAGGRAAEDRAAGARRPSSGARRGCATRRRSSSRQAAVRAAGAGRSACTLRRPR